MKRTNDLCVRLNGLKQNIPDKERIAVSYVNDYHDIISELEQMSKVNLSKFRVPKETLSTSSSITSPSRGVISAGDLVCERGILLSKIDALLLKFPVDEKKGKIGFNI